MLHLVRGLDVLSIGQTFEQLYRPDLVEAALKGDPQGKYMTPLTVSISRRSLTQALRVQFEPGAQVRAVAFFGGWVLIARDGQKIGYVPADALARIQ